GPAAGREQHRHPGARRRDGRPQEHHRRAVRPHRNQRDHVRLTTTAPPRTPRPRRLTPPGPYSHPHMLTADDAFILILSGRAHPWLPEPPTSSAAAARAASGSGGTARNCGAATEPGARSTAAGITSSNSRPAPTAAAAPRCA